LAPTSGHMVHMPGHIFYRVGNYAEAEHWFAASTEADERYMREQHVSPDDDWNYVHNMMYAIANLMEQGKLAEANSLSDHLSAARGELSATLYIWSARDQMSRVSRRLPVALRVADWDTVQMLLGQASLGDGEKTTNLRFLAAELTEFAKGMKALDNRDLSAATTSSDRMDAGLWRTKREIDAKDDAQKKADEAKKTTLASCKSPAAAAQATAAPGMPIAPDAMAGPLMSALTIASLELRAGILAGQGKLAEAKKMYESAMTEEKNMGYREPPFYIRPVGENEAVALLREKDFAGARDAYKEALQERPNSGFGLYGLARVSELSGDIAGAKTGYETFLKAWPAADPGMPEVVHARQVTGAPVATR
jgi:tetratricopeptide (TPR) repeat protein